jgi:hypothetical protein
VLNVIPLLKLDGYWLLADALDTPDLHEQAKAAVRRVVSGSRSRSDVVWATYAVTGLAFGLVLLAYGVVVYLDVVGHVVVSAWLDGLLGKALALAPALPARGACGSGLVVPEAGPEAPSRVTDTLPGHDPLSLFTSKRGSTLIAEPHATQARCPSGGVTTRGSGASMKLEPRRGLSRRLVSGGEGWLE